MIFTPDCEIYDWTCHQPMHGMQTLGKTLKLPSMASLLGSRVKRSKIFEQVGLDELIDGKFLQERELIALVVEIEGILNTCSSW